MIPIVDEERLRGQWDARVWAEEFVRLAKAKPDAPTDEGLMIGWFANAIMAGYDRGQAAPRDRPTDLAAPSLAEDDEAIVLPRSALLQFLGEVALPPWTDERGKTIGGGIDCAPIASRIIEWLDQHDLTGVVTP